MARSRYRSVRFDLEAAVAVALLVENAGGSIAPDLLAPALGYSGTNNGTYLTRVANARLFGLIGGRGTRVDLTDRGRRILSGVEPDASGARRQAFLAVPLFRAVFESVLPAAFEDRNRLAALLVERFGEPADKAPMAAAKFLESARQAKLLRVSSDGKHQVTRAPRIFTLVDNLRPSSLRRLVVKSETAQSEGRARPFRPAPGGDMDDSKLWLADESEDHAKGAPRRPRRRQVAVAVAAVACLTVVIVPVSVALTGGTSHPSAASKHHHAGNKRVTLGKGPAEHQVLGALSATTDSGSFDFNYDLTSTRATGGTVPSTTTTTECQVVPPGSLQGATIPGGVSVAPSEAPATTDGSGSIPAATEVCSPEGPIANPGTPVTGTGVGNIDPKATLVNATVGGGLTVSLRVDSTTLYEDLSSLQTSLAPPPDQANAPGQAISSFASITEATIGHREGAIAMIGLASPTGYLDLYQQDINGAAQTGTSTVNGAPVTVYQVAVDPTQLANAPGTTSEESKTAADAVTVLKNEGYTGTTDQVSIDAAGFIREVRSVARFSDGGTVVLDVVLSNFGCAGTVLMPGQQGSGAPPSGCTSPDTGTAATTTPSTTTPPGTATAGATTTTQVATTPTEPPSTVPPDTSTTVANPTSTTG